MKTNANGNALQEQPKTGVMPTNPTKVVVLQHGPKVDEATAAAIASVYYKKLGFQVQIWSFRNQYPDHVWMEEWWTKDGVAPLLIDVGKEK